MVQTGELWAYRARGIDPLVEVAVVRLGSQKPERVLVRFVDEVFEGRQEWVPPGRLRVPWARVGEFVAREERWDRVVAAGLPRDDPREGAAELVFTLLVDDAVARMGYRERGTIHIARPDELAAGLGLEVGKLRDHPAAFVEDDVLVAPWPITELVVSTAARRNPEPVMERVAAKERRAKHEAIHGRSYGSWGGEGYTVPAEICAEVDAERGWPVRELLRSWCGVAAGERSDELIELREEVRRLGVVAERAIEALRNAGHASEASRLQRELGMTVEMLRVSDPSAR